MRFGNLERYRKGGSGDVMELSVPLPTTPEGRVYRYSPNEDAHPRHFVLGDTAAGFAPREDLRSRMKQEPGSPATVCPYSGVIAEDEEFNHPDDVEAAMAIVEHAAMEDVERAFGEIFDDLAKSTRGNKFVTIESKGGFRPTLPPRFGRRDLMRLLVCDHCGRDYGVYAIALYCPDCGAPNVRLHFAREVELVGKQVDLADGLAPEAEELAYRLLGNAHEDVLTAFEATLKTVYAHLIAQSPDLKGSVKRIGNDFQNIERSKERFAPLGFDPFAGLSADELDVLGLNIQKRHVVGHNLGMVDEKFAAVAGGARLGETVKLVGSDVKLFAALAQKVVTGLDARLAPEGAAAAPVLMAPVDPQTIAASLPPLEPPLKDRIAHWLCAHSDDGMEGWMKSTDEFAAAFEGAERDDVVMALADLEIDGLVGTRDFGEALPMVRLLPPFYAAFDPIVMKTDPYADALELADRLLADKSDSIGVADLHESTGWDRRRFNPAVQLIIGEVGDGRVSAEMQNEYPARYFFLIPEDRARIKRLAARLRGK